MKEVRGTTFFQGLKGLNLPVQGGNFGPNFFRIFLTKNRLVLRRNYIIVKGAFRISLKLPDSN